MSHLRLSPFSNSLCLVERLVLNKQWTGFIQPPLRGDQQHNQNINKVVRTEPVKTCRVLSEIVSTIPYIFNNKNYRDLPGQNYHRLQLILTRESAYGLSWGFFEIQRQLVASKHKKSATNPELSYFAPIQLHLLIKRNPMAHTDPHSDKYKGIFYPT